MRRAILALALWLCAIPSFAQVRLAQEAAVDVGLAEFALGQAIRTARSPFHRDLNHNAGVAMVRASRSVDTLQRPVESLRLLLNARRDGTELSGEPGVPELYMSALASWSQIAARGQDYRRFIFRLGDSWAHSNAAAWWVMECMPGTRCAR